MNEAKTSPETRPAPTGVELRVLLQDIRKIEAEALVVGCYEDVRPLRGMAGELDWLLCGALSRLLLTGRFSGTFGDSALTTTRGKIKVRKLFMVGMGPQGRFSEEGLRAYARAVATCLLNAGVASAVVEYAALPDLEDGRHLRAMREGLREGSGGRTLDVQLIVQDALVYERVSRLVNAC